MFMVPRNAREISQLWHVFVIRKECLVSVWPGNPFNTLRPRQNGRHFAYDIFKCIFLSENAWISLKISLKFVPKVRINNISALVQIMAWRRPSDKPLSEPMMVSLLTHICVTRPQWVNTTVILVIVLQMMLEGHWGIWFGSRHYRCCLIWWRPIGKLWCTSCALAVLNLFSKT